MDRPLRFHSDASPSETNRIQGGCSLFFKLELKVMLAYDFWIEGLCSPDGERRFRVGHPERCKPLQFRKEPEGQGFRFHLRIHLKIRKKILRI